MIPPTLRVRLSETDGPFVSHAVRIARISFTLMDGDQPDIRGAGTFSTAVIAWPVDGAGYLDEERVRAMEARVLRWDLSAAELSALRELHLDGWRFTTS